MAIKYICLIFTVTIGVILLIAIIEHSTATLDEQLRNYANKFMSSGKDFCKVSCINLNN